MKQWSTSRNNLVGHSEKMTAAVAAAAAYTRLNKSNFDKSGLACRIKIGRIMSRFNLATSDSCFECILVN